ncbi:MAG: phasin family protein [Alphaproteobacteria bacterium]|nr:phasin family protein [Alphaproteobacteria bacterium]MBV8409839.1 phasin family protein [Alphaproteobacteria bacterium]
MGYFGFLSLNLKAIFEAYQKNMTALAKANQVALDAFSTLMERQSALWHATAEECSRGVNDVMAAASLEEKARLQADTARHAYDSTVARIGDLYEVATKAQVAAADILNTRLAEALEECKVLFAAQAESAATAETVVHIAAPVAPAEPAATEFVEADGVTEEAAAPSAAETDTAETSVEAAPVATSPEAIEEPADDEDNEAPTAPRRSPKPRGPRTGSGGKAARRPPSRG